MLLLGELQLTRTGSGVTPMVHSEFHLGAFVSVGQLHAGIAACDESIDLKPLVPLVAAPRLLCTLSFSELASAGESLRDRIVVLVGTEHGSLDEGEIACLLSAGLVGGSYAEFELIQATIAKAPRARVMCTRLSAHFQRHRLPFPFLPCPKNAMVVLDAARQQLVSLMSLAFRCRRVQLVCPDSAERAVLTSGLRDASHAFGLVRSLDGKALLYGTDVEHGALRTEPLFVLSPHTRDPCQLSRGYDCWVVDTEQKLGDESVLSIYVGAPEFFDARACQAPIQPASTVGTPPSLLLGVLDGLVDIAKGKKRRAAAPAQAIATYCAVMSRYLPYVTSHAQYNVYRTVDRLPSTIKSSLERAVCDRLELLQSAFGINVINTDTGAWLVIVPYACDMSKFLHGLYPEMSLYKRNKLAVRLKKRVRICALEDWDASLCEGLDGVFVFGLHTALMPVREGVPTLERVLNEIGELPVMPLVLSSATNMSEHRIMMLGRGKASLEMASWVHNIYEAIGRSLN